MKQIVVFVLLGFLWTYAAANDDGHVGTENLCGTCHAIPPGTARGDGRFKPGAHSAHAAIGCETCHQQGGGVWHVDGFVSMQPALGYEFGTKVPWPGMGGGSCGGTSLLIQGCHQQAKTRCAWIPGENCTTLKE